MECLPQCNRGELDSTSTAVATYPLPSCSFNLVTNRYVVRDLEIVTGIGTIPDVLANVRCESVRIYASRWIPLLREIDLSTSESP